MDISRTTARLRRTFHYPTDESSSTSTPDVLDEQEQETVIATLAADNAARNASFRKLLLVLPVLGAVPVLIALVSSRASSSLLAAALALSSLASTGYLVFRLPAAATGIPTLDAWAASSGAGTATGAGRETRSGDDGGEDNGYGEGEEDLTDARWSGGTRTRTRARMHNRGGVPRHVHFEDRASYSSLDMRSPLETYLPYLNIALGITALLAGLGLAARGSDGDGLRALGRVGAVSLPLVIYVAVLVAKVVMAGVDPERELGGLRYGLKGA